MSKRFQIYLACVTCIIYGQDISDLAFSTSAPPHTPPIAGKSLRVLHAKPLLWAKTLQILRAIPLLWEKTLQILHASPLLWARYCKS